MTSTDQSYRQFLLVLRQGFLLVSAWIERQTGLNGTAAAKYREAAPLILDLPTNGRALTDEEVDRIADAMLAKLHARDRAVR